MLFTSLQRLFQCGSWIYDTEEFHFLMKHCGKDYLTIDDKPLSYESILTLTNLEFTIGCTSSRPDLHKTWRAFSVWCCQPFVSYITVPSCAESFKVAQRYTRKRASKDRLKEAHDKAYSAKIRVNVPPQGIQDLANTLCCEAANPNFEESIRTCFYGYILGMDQLGMSIKRVNTLQRNEFLRLVLQK
jgi:hypothetical protein